MPQTLKDIDTLCINTIRALSIDAVQTANSGHPGAPLGEAPMAYTLWNRHLRHNPENPRWQDRDRFILSCGHASAMLYSLLHLFGYPLSLQELKNFRQWNSLTPGHPEYHLTPGVETTTGPLGQGFANAVGMAMAVHWLAERYNRPGFELFGHRIYVMASDGDMQEGISSEAGSLAGHLRLGRLICLYDDNGIQIEGSTDLAFSEDVGKRFRAFGWHVAGPVDGMDVEAVDRAICEAKDETERPSLVICRTVIGWGSPGEGDAKVHGSPLGADGVRATREKIRWPQEVDFYMPREASDHMGRAVEKGRELEMKWNDLLTAYLKEYPDKGKELNTLFSGSIPDNWFDGAYNLFPPELGSMATREASGKVLNQLAGRIFNLMGGSADLAPSNKTMIDGEESFGADGYRGRNIHFGVREHAMTAIASGMSLHGTLLPYTGTFLTFADYMRPAIRLAALMGIRVVYVFTHDSIGLGEDGPTHQPVEQLMSLRLIPNLTVIRPSDATETAWSWQAAIANTKGPTALILTRQKVPIIDRSKYPPAENLLLGAYVLWDSTEEGDRPDLILISSGSEVFLSLGAGKKLSEQGLGVRVISMPSWEIFDKQPREYREKILPPRIKARVAVEAGITTGWEKYIGLDGRVVGMTTFGASAPYKVLYEKFDLTVGNIIGQCWDVIESLKNKSFVS